MFELAVNDGADVDAVNRLPKGQHGAGRRSLTKGRQHYVVEEGLVIKKMWVTGVTAETLYQSQKLNGKGEVYHKMFFDRWVGAFEAHPARGEWAEKELQLGRVTSDFPDRTNQWPLTRNTSCGRAQASTRG